MKAKEAAAKTKEEKKTPKLKEKEEKETVPVSKFEQKGKHSEEKDGISKRILGKKQMQ